MRSLSLLLLLSACAYDDSPAPADTTRRTDRALCYQYADEDPYDSDRSAYLQSRVEDYCK